MYIFIGDFSTNFRHKTFSFFCFFKGCFAALCVLLGLKKPGDFTVSEGIRLQMFRFFAGMGLEWRKKKKGRHGQIVSDCHGHPLVVYIFSKIGVLVTGLDLDSKPTSSFGLRNQTWFQFERSHLVPIRFLLMGTESSQTGSREDGMAFEK